MAASVAAIRSAVAPHAQAANRRCDRGRMPPPYRRAPIDRLEEASPAGQSKTQEPLGDVPRAPTISHYSYAHEELRPLVSSCFGDFQRCSGFWLSQQSGRSSASSSGDGWWARRSKMARR